MQTYLVCVLMPKDTTVPKQTSMDTTGAPCVDCQRRQGQDGHARSVDCKVNDCAKGVSIAAMLHARHHRAQLAKAGKFHEVTHCHWRAWKLIPDR
eukprot:366197-Chlamydomonas_euryale.AAC.15